VPGSFARRDESFHQDRTKGIGYPTRVICKFGGKRGQIVLDQIRTVDKSRLVRRLGKIDKQSQSEVLSILTEMFAP
jgi:mRNA interferase MazF